MIRITGKDRNRILDTYNVTKEVQNDKARFAHEKSKVVSHTYQQFFPCGPANITDDAVEIKTYHEPNDRNILLMSAAINGLEIEVEVV